MKKWLAAVGLAAAFAGAAGAWRPAAWAYHDYPWAYDAASGDWYWFNPDEQWVVNMDNGQWARLPNSAVASGWNYYDWGYVYAQGNGAWHWINDADAQWVANMRTAAWSRYGAAEVPAGMALVPAGEFTMGDAFAEGSTNELPAHAVDVGAFCMDATEVTWGQWTEVRAWATNHGYAITDAGGKATNHPAHSVRWNEAAKWCNARSEKEGLTPCYYANAAQTNVFRAGTNDMGNAQVKWDANGYRLPTEAEWEKAARGGAAGMRFPWGDTNAIQHARANYRSSVGYAYDVSPTRGYHPDYVDGSNPFLYTSPAGAFAPNGYGLYDMAGNVKEWCWDRFSETYYVETPAADPQGPSTGTTRVVRDGSWGSTGYAAGVRCAARGGSLPTVSSLHLGFRCVRRVEGL